MNDEEIEAKINKLVEATDMNTEMLTGFFDYLDNIADILTATDKALLKTLIALHPDVNVMNLFIKFLDEEKAILELEKSEAECKDE